jgi:methylated-DNA-[protein]-cysteine S-methyltransferase
MNHAPAPIETWTIETPVRPLTVLARDQLVIAAGFTTAQELWARLGPAEQGQEGPVERPDLGKISKLVEDYLDGQLDALDRIPVSQPGTDLQHEVWAALRAIPAGQTRTYTELAAATTRPQAVRAAGTACGRNLIAPMVPCHRALRRDGSLGGYYYGLDVKRWLLDHEARASS